MHAVMARWLQCGAVVEAYVLVPAHYHAHDVSRRRDELVAQTFDVQAGLRALAQHDGPLAILGEQVAQLVVVRLDVRYVAHKRDAALGALHRVKELGGRAWEDAVQRRVARRKRVRIEHLVRAEHRVGLAAAL